MGEPLRRAGYAMSAVALSAVVTAVAPNIVISVASILAGSFLIGLILAPFFAVQALVSPARVRTLSFSFGAIFLALGVVLFFVLGFGTISDQHGIRWGI